MSTRGLSWSDPDQCTGYTSLVPGATTDYATVAYSAAGVPFWTNVYDPPGGGDDHARAVAVDAAGNVFVTGESVAPYADNDYVTIGYSGAGEGLWTNRFNGAGNGNDYATSLAVDQDGNVIVTGYSADDYTGNRGDYVTIKYANSGLPLWTNHYHGPNELYVNDTATAVVADGNGHVIVTGNSVSSSGRLDYATVAYASDGVPLWTNRYNGGASGDAIATSVGVDASGNVFVTGNFGGDYATIKYSSEGVALWTNYYNGPARGNDQPQSKSCLAIGLDGAVYVTGASDGDYSATTTYDYATVKYVSLPEIASQPASRTNNVGTTATFTVVATGSAPLVYQWQRYQTNLVNGGNVLGAATNRLTLMNVQQGDAGNYAVFITNAFGSVTSFLAVLTTVMPSLVWLGSATMTNDVFSFSFSNTRGASFSVLSSTNLNLPLSEWTPVGGVTENPPGHFRFDDAQLTGRPQKFYRVLSP